jgi:hypothetical protein
MTGLKSALQTLRNGACLPAALGALALLAWPSAANAQFGLNVQEMQEIADKIKNQLPDGDTKHIRINFGSPKIGPKGNATGAQKWKNHWWHNLPPPFLERG